MGIKGGGLLLYVREHIPSRKIVSNICSDIEAIIIEINLKKSKWVFICTYCPHKSMIENHMEIISMQLNEYQNKYDNFVIMGDLNSEIGEDAMKDFCSIYNFKSLINTPTCFKNPLNPSCIDLILTNKPRSFQKSSTIETGLSDCHRCTVTVMKTTFMKQEPKIIYYRNFKNFINNIFRRDLIFEIDKIGPLNISCNEFENIFLDTLNKHAPLKKRYIRANNAPYMTKSLCKVIMVRSRLRNRFIKLSGNQLNRFSRKRVRLIIKSHYLRRTK